MYIDYWVVVLQLVLAIGAISRGWRWQPVFWYLGIVAGGTVLLLTGMAPEYLTIFNFSLPDLIFIGVTAYMVFNPRNR